MKLIRNILLLAVFAALALPAQADRGRGRHGDRDDERDYELSLEEAAELIREKNGGRILDIRRKRDGYEVKSLRRGRVRVYEIDGHSGEVRHR